MSSLNITLRAIALSGMMLGVPAVALAQDNPSDLKKENESLRAKIDQVEAQQAAQNKALLEKIKQLESQQQNQQAREQEQQKALEQKVQQVVRQKAEQDEAAALDSVVKDADRHSKMLDSMDATLSYDFTNGLVFKSGDGKLLVHPWLQFQFDYELNYQYKGKANGEDQTNLGFEVHHLRLGTDGYLFTPDFTYEFSWDRSTGFFLLQDAWLKYNIPNTPSLAVRGGQFKNPFDHEELVDDRYQLAFDRSYTEGTLANGEGYVEGVSLIYDPGTALRGEVAFTDGNARSNSSFLQFPNAGSPDDWGLAARAEYKVWGNWDEYRQFTSLNDKEQLLVAGAAFDVTQAGRNTQFSHVLDAQWNRGPIGAYAAFLGRFTSNVTADHSSSYDFSFRVQGSYLLTKQWEPFARYSFTHFDSDEFAANVQNNVNELTFGVNYYIYNHTAKVTADVIFLPTGATLADTPLGVLANNNHGEILVHAQFQLLL